MQENAVTPIIQYIQQYVDLDIEATELITDHFREVVFPKGHQMIRGGDIAHNYYFILSGKARSYYIDHSGKTTTWMFHFNEAFSNIKNLFMVDYKSFLTQSPGTLYIEAYSDVRALQCSFYSHKYLLEHIPVFEQWMRKLNENSFIVTYNRFFTLMTMPAPARYSQMIKEEPFLLQMFSHYHIASYLGIAPQSLSRIRSAIS